MWKGRIASSLANGVEKDPLRVKGITFWFVVMRLKDLFSVQNPIVSSDSNTNIP